MQYPQKTVRVAILGTENFIATTIEKLRDQSAIRCTFVYAITQVENQSKEQTRVNIFQSSGLKTFSLKEFLTKSCPEIDRLIVSNQKSSLFQSKQKKIRDFCLANEIQIFELDKYHFLTKIPFLTENSRPKELDFLLERPVNHLDIERISSQLHGERILITGAAGSIGSEIVKQLSIYDCDEIGLLDQAESSLFDLQQELKATFPGKSYRYFVSDVTLEKRMEFLISEFRPTIIFHTAAYKHVPLMEIQPYESIRVNVGGVVNMASIAMKYNVNRFVMVSSDKAVNPSNVMGACKRICELYLQALAQSPECLTKFIITRFGNVLGSNGSVVPLFINQILRNRPINLTSKLISRYFMTISEACELVLEAGLVGNKGEIFIFDMGKPVKIYDLVIKLIRSFGLRPNVDVKINEVGLRPGEKLSEELFGTLEQRLPTHNPKIFISKVQPIDSVNVMQNVTQLLSTIDQNNSEELVRKIKKIVVNYISKNSPFIRLDQQ